MNNQHQPLSGGALYDRDRELEDQRQRVIQQQDEINRQERVRDREREESERQHQEYQPAAPPHHSSAGAITIHQPVASRIANSIHNPGGLLANHGGPGPSLPIGASLGPTASFGGPLLGDSARPPQHSGPGVGPAPNAHQHQVFTPLGHGSGGAIGVLNGGSALFGGHLQPDKPRAVQQDGGRPVQQIQFGPALGVGHPVPAGPGAMSQGQQPILNDALSYLDQVKVQFHEQPDVYNKFLDIMKDFKSQTIDTPGVISRVSELFAGHPNLIQGFNTFLPPGYRIECGSENNPNSIRVTTPSGSTIHSIGASRTAQGETTQPTSGPGQQYAGPRPGTWAPVQHSVESPEAKFIIPAPTGATECPPVAQSAPFEDSSPHQPRAIPATTNGAMPALNHGPVPRGALTPTPSSAQASLNGSAAQQANMEKRGPVEFNHAISYVNKIKNRFQDKPEIYKQFLEILQTYQREQKPIQDVYSQVTALFHTAPDLLDDFKQFLPESAASTNNRTGPARVEEAMAVAAVIPTPQTAHPARDGPKMPPVGNFAPPSASKENKKRPRQDKAAVTPTSAPNDVSVSSMRSTILATSNKRLKLSHKQSPPDGVFVEPSLMLVMPEPLEPTPVSVSSQDDLVFFDRLKKHVGNRTALLEFLKLINMYTMDLISQQVLLYKASQFIGGNAELLNAFKDMFIGNAGEEDIVENRPEPPTGRVSLSNCRGFGPSYRLLPKRERLKPCSGRDELCKSVLNDEWASHPTWASEDSGFVAHRKNGYEEGLHRIEEERHDYDFFIEANQKCIQLLEPISQQMLAMTNPADRAAFKLPIGLGGQSTSIYRRVLKKMYGPEKGAEVANEMFKNPFSVVPIVMARLKQKDEEWRFTQREWEKVWQAQTEAMHLKSLDHMGIQVKSNDKRNLAAKHLVDVIKTKHEEQKRIRVARGKTPRYQFLYSFEDQELLLDLLRLMVLFATVGGQHNNLERRRILEFFENFIPQFFDLPEDKVRERIEDIDQDSGEEDEEDPTPVELTAGRTRRHGKKSDLLRGVLDPGRNGSRSRPTKEDSAGSKETTPDVTFANEEDMPDAPDDAPVPEVFNNRWLPTIPGPIIVDKKRRRQEDLVKFDGDLKADAVFPRSWYNFYCNQNIYVFFTVFQTLYKRLQGVKESKKSASEELRKQKAQKPAKILGFIHQDALYFEDEDPETFWPKTMELMEDFINGEIDEARYQEVLRHYFLAKGWTLYTIQDLLKTLCRIGLACNNPDTKGEKTKELVKAYLESRQQEETSFQDEMSARKFAEKCIKDGEMFVICWSSAKKEATVRWLQKEETTFYTDEMERIQQWQYYISSYMRIDPTEGVERGNLRKCIFQRNLPSDGLDAFEDGCPAKPLLTHEGLVCRICLNTSKMVFEKGTSDSFIFNTIGIDATKEEQRVVQTELRAQWLKERLVTNNAWMKGLPQDEVQRVKQGYQKFKEQGPEALDALATAAAAAADAGAME